MSFEAVQSFIAQNGLADRVHHFEVSSATVQLAAEALGCAPERIAKSLSFLAQGLPILVVAAGDAKVDNARYKAQFGCKATMLTPAQAVELIGHAVGGVCPFCLKSGVHVYLDESLRRFETVYPACGDAASAVELTLPELEKLSGGSWVDVCKGWRDEG